MQRDNGTYLDFNATTPPDPRVVESIPGWLKAWGNPSSIHTFGRAPKQLLRESRDSISKLLEIHPLEIVFTSGGSESNSMIIRGVWNRFRGTNRRKFLLSSIEHASLRGAMAAIEADGAIVKTIPVNFRGELDLDFIKSELDESVALVSVMLANNETGVIYPIRHIADQAHAVGALMHSDCVQGLGKIPFSLKDLGVDLASISGHKFYALRGSGLVYIKRGVDIPALILGGGQERGRRGGTENILAIASLGLMARQRDEIAVQANRIRVLRDQMEKELLATIPGLEIAGAGLERVPNTSCLILPEFDGETILMNLDLLGFAVSTGAACSAGNPEPSPILLAMGFGRQRAQRSIRVSLGWSTIDDDIRRFTQSLMDCLARLRRLAAAEPSIATVDQL